MRRSGWLLRPAVLVSAVYLGYLNSFWGAFQFDDYLVVVDNPRVHAWSSWLVDLGGIRPLLKLSYTLNWTSGLGLFGFHLFNVNVHAANAVLVYVLFTQFGAPAASPARQPSAPLDGPLIGALLFALHPVQTEAVTYISGRSIGLMTSFYLGSVLAYVRGTRSRSPAVLYGFSPSLFVLAMLTKEIAVTLPLALLLWETRTGRRMDSWRELWRRQAVHWLLLVAALVALTLHARYWELLTLSFREQDLRTVLLTQIHGVTYLVGRLARVQGLNIDPDLRVLSAWSPTVIAEAASLLAVLALAVIVWRRRPWWGFAVAWLVLHLLPTNSLVLRLDVANERHLYLACCGLFFAVGKEIEALIAAWPAHPRLAHAGVIALVVTLGYCSAARNRDYRDEIALWEATVRTSPRKARAHNNLGAAYARAGRYEEARARYLVALGLDPDFDIARENLALLDSTNREPSSHETRPTRSGP